MYFSEPGHQDLSPYFELPFPVTLSAQMWFNLTMGLNEDPHDDTNHIYDFSMNKVFISLHN